MELSTAFSKEDDSTPINDMKTFSNQAQRFGVLSPQQFYKLQHILLTPVSIGGCDPHFPTLVIKPYELIQKIKRILKQHRVPVRAVKMNGSTAGYVLQEVPGEKKRENTDEDYEYTAEETPAILAQDDIYPVDNSDSNSESSTGPGSYLSESETDFASGTDSGSVNSEPELTRTFAELNMEDNNNNNNLTHISKNFTPTDLDIIFEVDLNSHLDYQSVKSAVLLALYEFYPSHLKTDSLTISNLEAPYVPRKKKIWQNQGNGDKWSLLSLHNSEGKNIDLKFISHLKRSFEFSVDSFQIYLDVLCDYLSDEFKHSLSESAHSIPFGIQVTVETKYSNLQDALDHLNNKIIETHNPEEIRGGGLLKYCYLLIHEFEPASIERQRSLERYMCSRFFIDFHIRSPDYEQKVLSYLSVHFPGAAYPQTAEGYMEVVKVISFLRTLQAVARRSAICLGKEDLNLALTIIDLIINRYTQPQFLTYSLVPCYMPTPILPNSNNFSKEESVTKSKVYVEDSKQRKSPNSNQSNDESKYAKSKTNTHEYITRHVPHETHKVERQNLRETQRFGRQNSNETQKFERRNSPVSLKLERRNSLEPQNPERRNSKESLEQNANTLINAPQFFYNIMPVFAYPNLRPFLFTPPMLYNQTQQQNMIYTQSKQAI